MHRPTSLAYAMGSNGDEIMNVSEILENAMEDLRLRVPEIEAAALVTADGLIVAASGSLGVAEDQLFLGGVMATALTAGERISAELDRGSFENFFVKGEKGYVLLTGIGEDKVLALVANEKVKLGMLFLEAKRLSDMLEEIFKTQEL